DRENRVEKPRRGEVAAEREDERDPREQEACTLRRAPRSSESDEEEKGHPAELERPEVRRRPLEEAVPREAVLPSVDVGPPDRERARRLEEPRGVDRGRGRSLERVVREIPARSAGRLPRAQDQRGREEPREHRGAGRRRERRQDGRPKTIRPRAGQE